MLVLFGATTIYGNMVLGKVLFKNAMKSVVYYPFAIRAFRIYIVKNYMYSPVKRTLDLSLLSTL